jgi:hypothetical protein
LGFVVIAQVISSEGETCFQSRGMPGRVNVSEETVHSDQERVMRRFFISACVLGLVVGLTASVSQAALLVYEGFDYDPGTLRGNDGGGGLIGWGGPWVRQDNTTAGVAATVTAGSMSYTDAGGNSLATSGNKASVPTTSGNANRDFRNFGGTIVGTATPEVWLSFMAQAGSTGAGHVGVALFNGATEIVTLGKGGSPTNWGFAGPGTTTVNRSVDATTESLLVYRFLTDPGTGAVSGSLWINPELDAAPTGTPDVTWTHSAFTINRIRVSQAQAAEFTMLLDEFRVGTTFESVIPEPAAVGLLGLAGVAMLRRRRA